MGLGLPETKRVENIDVYEREKIERTLVDARRLVAVMENYLEMVKFCDEKGIVVKGRTMFDQLRFPDGPAGPDGDLGKIEAMFQSGQKEIARNLREEEGDLILQRIQGKKQIM